MSALRLLLALVATALVAVACSQGPSPASTTGPGTSPGGTDSRADGTGTAKAGSVAAGTCWAGDLLGADPQDVLRLSDRFAVPYLVTARAVADRPAFARSQDCDEEHTIEVYKVLRLPKLEARLADYSALLRTRTPLYANVSRSVAAGCMNETLAKSVARSGLPDVVMEPVLPAGATLGWAPAPPDRWASGERVFACTLSWSVASEHRYADVFTKVFPTAKRTCIDNTALVFVDCARRHHRERIALIEARDAVDRKALPGKSAVRTGPQGRYVDLGPAAYVKLDAACTTYLRAISTTKKLTGVANADVDEWPAPGGSYPVYCDADTPPAKKPLVTQGSVYNR